MKRKSNAKIDHFVYIMVTIAAVITLLLTEALLDSKVNVDAADETEKLLLEEVKNVIDRNENETAVLTESLKDDYITRARAVSYIVEHNKALESNVLELKRIADLMNVDEVHLFDTDGVIYYGTNPEYYGFSMDDGEQIGFLNPCCQTEICQCVRMLLPIPPKAKA